MHLLKDRFFHDRAAFYLIGIKPEYQNKGLTAIIFKEMNEMFNRHGINEVETNPELEDNKAVQALWKNYDNQLHKRRRTYRKEL
jgi:ribosomal protein S18 acetylase RimI-like enzyme